MHRHISTLVLAIFAAGLVFATPALAGDDALRDKVRQLEEQVEALSGQQSTQLEQTIEQYLDESSAWQAAQAGDGTGGVNISAAFTANFFATVDGANDPPVADDNLHEVSGDVDLNFHMEVTESLDLHIDGTANTNGNFFSALANEGFFFDSFDSQSQLSGGPVVSFSAFSWSGATDGIGVNGNTPTDPGSFTIYQAYIVHEMPMGEGTLYWELGAIDPRTRFSQNAFADDENTQFINNLFDDSPTMLWLSDASGRTVLGWHFWTMFGQNKQFTLNGGWFNIPGSFFDHGQFLIQFSWKGEVNGREMNLRLFGFIDEFFVDATGDGSAGGGVSWDWLLNDKIGLFVRITTTGGDVNPVELDASVGAAFMGIIESRPDDTIGVAIGWLSTNNTVTGVLPEDTELTLELYYRYMREGGKLQITPFLMMVMDPFGGGTGVNDLFILGLRIHVPF